MTKKAVILLSGGLDSATCLAVAKSQGFECYTLGFDYGQRHYHELECAKKLSPNHKIVTISNFGGSALVDSNIAVPKTPLPQGGVGGGEYILNAKYGFRDKELIQRAKDLRKNSTEPEKKLWQALKSKQINNHKFRRQEVIGHYIVDFVCYEKNLVIEIDGDSHAFSEEYDAKRTRELEKYGLKVLRFWNNEVIENLGGVLHIISESLEKSTPHPNPLPKGEGDVLPPLGRELEVGEHIPVTYVPARNTIFLSYALAYAEVLGVSDIFIGVNALDYSGYPDCRPEYIDAFQKMANLATKSGDFKINTPLINLTKAEIIKLGISLGVDYSLTSSCYDPAPDGTACGECDSCRLRLKGFAESGVSDKIKYST